MMLSFHLKRKFKFCSATCIQLCHTTPSANIPRHADTARSDAFPEPPSYAPYLSEILPLNKDPPKKTKVVVCGGGMVGASMAYHLSALGWGPDLLLLEQGKFGGPTSWRGSGFLGGVKHGETEMNILLSSLNLVKKLENDGFDTGWRKCGSLHLARTKMRITNFRKMKAIAEARGRECYILKPSEVDARYPMLNTSDLEGAFWVPNDGSCDPYKLCISLLKVCMDQGIHLVEACKISRIVVQDGNVVAVETSKGIIECSYFVNAGGTWAHKIGKMSEPNVKVPIHPAEHYYLQTYPLEGIDSNFPALRDPDGNIYMREYNGGILAGAFEKWAKPTFEHGELPEEWHMREQGPDWDHFHGALKEMLHRLPLLHNAILRNLYNTGDGFSPDCRWILGQSPEIPNYFVAAGMKSGGSNAAMGIAELISKWIVNGVPPIDTHELDIQRFIPAHNNIQFLRDRVVEVPGVHYANAYPFPDFATGRCLRMPPVFSKLKAAGAVFGQVMGYERPSYFLKPGHEDQEQSEGGEAPYRIAITDTWTKPDWFDYTAAEYEACRERCAILDYSSFAKFDVWSKDNEAFKALQYLCSNDVDIPVGGIIHTGMQNRRGGYENDCSLARIAANHYMMISPSIQQTRCGTWLRRNLPSDGSIVIKDVTSMYTALCLMGPLAKNVLSEVTDVDLSTKAFPFFSFKEIDIGFANGIRAMNLTHTGELGWALYIPNEYALHVYENLIEAGQKYDMVHAGYYAMRSLRVEKFYAFWGPDIDSTTTPLECGRAFRVKLDKDIDFVGRRALEIQKRNGVSRLYVYLILEDHNAEIDPWPSGGEPIYRNGKFVGVTTTTSYGFTLQKIVCLGFIRKFDRSGNREIVTPDYVMNGVYEIDIAGVKFSANVSLRSPTLPSNVPDSTRDRYVATQI